MSKEPFEQFYRRQFPEGGNSLEAYHRELEARVSDARSILDLGCGDNRELARYRSPSRKVWGTDFQMHPSLATPEWFRLLPANGKLPFPDASFDLIGSCWVLEHVRDPAAFLAEVQRVLRPNGAFVSLSINSLHYVTFLTRLLGTLPHIVTQSLVRKLYGREPHDTFPTHYRMNATGSLRRQARQAGFEFEGLTRVADPGYFSFSPLLHRLAVRLDWLLDRITGDLGRIYFVSILRKPASKAERSFPAVAATPARRRAA